MRTEALNYELPKQLIALEPPPQRGRSRLLVVDRETEEIVHANYYDIPDRMRKDDVVVLNETHVPKARVFMVDRMGRQKFEILFNKPLGDRTWEVLIGGRNIKPGMVIVLEDREEVSVTIIREIDSQPLWEIQLEGIDFKELAEKYGHVPLPPYIKRTDTIDDEHRYNTIFGKSGHSAAAPTASINLTAEMIDRIEGNGAKVSKVRLDVGWGTFAPIRTYNIEEHHIHSEYIQIDKTNSEIISDAVSKGSRVWAFGTTVARALESASNENGKLPAQFSGETDIYIYPGYKWKVVDVLVTNFHAPKTSLLALVASFMGYELMMEAYRVAIKEKYRFLSYGDSMLIL